MPKGEKAETRLGVLSMALANFDSWIRSPRTVLMLIFVVAICYLQMCGYKMTLDNTGYTMHLGETLFYEFNFGCNMPMTTAIFLIMVSELPKKIPFQQYSLIRSSRWRWTLAQILYCFMMVLAMLFLILLCITIFAMPLVIPGNGWSDIIRLSQGIIESEEALIDVYIMNEFGPWRALFVAAIPMFCFWFTMVLIILLFGIWGKPVWGVLAYAFIMVAHVTIYFEYFPINIVMPMHYGTLQNLTAGHQGFELEQLTKVIIAYIILILSLITTMLLSVKKTDLSIYIGN